MHPPTNLDASSCDLLIGISVFTHLGEPEQDEWLAELQRIASPGAVVLMSTHGNAAVCRSNWDLPMLAYWQERGFLDGLSHDLDGFIDDPNYYRNTFHTTSYIRRHWSKYFQILDIIPGYIGNFQDLVVMRKV